MPKFDVGQAVETLEYDLSTLRDPETGKPYVNVKGVVKEPSDQMIGDFLDGLKELYKTVQGTAVGKIGEMPDNAAPEDMLEALSNLSGQDFVDMHASAAGLFSALCSGRPAKDHLLKLPIRARGLFYGWLMDEVVNPEAGTAAGTAQVTVLPTAARG